MLRTLALLLTLALFAVACGGEDDATVADVVADVEAAATDIDADDLDADDIEAAAEDAGIDTDAVEAAASDAGIDTDADLTGDDSVVCFGLGAVLEGYDDVIDAANDSDQQREAAELVGQFGREVADFLGNDAPPELQQALDTLQANAASIVSEGASAAEDAEIDEALATVGEAEANCTELG